MKPEVVAADVPFGEGPVWCPDGTLVVTSVSMGALYGIDPQTGASVQIADTGGGANGAVLASDGGFLVTQNGGIDFAAIGIFDNPPPYRPAPPGLQRVHPDGHVEYVTGEGYLAPNDLCVAADGTVYFTDPGPPPFASASASGTGAALREKPSVGRVMALHPDGSVTELATGFWYCNGIAVCSDGSIVVVERTGLMRVAPDGTDRAWIVEHLGSGAGDGFCRDADGRFYVAATVEHGVRVVDPDGTIVDFLEIPGGGVTTNCCFGGADGRTLFATDAVPGAVVAWEGMPTPGVSLPTWEVPA